VAEYIFKLPDVGEGLADAEVVEWCVAVGDRVEEDALICSVMTDKAAVEIPSPVSGTVLWLGAEVGQVLPIGADLIRFDTADTPAVDSSATATEEALPTTAAVASDPPEGNAANHSINTISVSKPAAKDALTEKPLAAPSVRMRAMEAGVELSEVTGTGPAGRIVHEDLDLFLERGAQPQANPAGAVKKTSVTEVKLIGLRRKIAEKMVLAKSRIPHITYVEELEMIKLEELRSTLNETRSEQQTRLTLLPFLMCAIVKAVAEQPELNATFDDEKEVIYQHAGVHIGIATQTESGLLVPVVRHAESLDVWGAAAEVARLAEGARNASLKREELTGSTITISSLGKMGGLVSTPVINHPEVAIIGINKMQMRPVWDGNQFVARSMMNVSASFDHRIVDGWDAATFVQRVKTLIESPAIIFMP